MIKKQSLRTFKRFPTNANLQAGKVIHANKKNGWHEYESKLNARTSRKKCWDVVGKINGKGGSLSIKHLKKNGHKITQPKDIANATGEAIFNNLFSSHYQLNFNAPTIDKRDTLLDFYLTK